MNTKLAIFLVVTLASSTTFAADTISYVGWLNNSATGPVNGDIVADFALYAEEDGTESLWSEHYDGLDVVDGWLVAELGSVTEFGESVDWGVETNLWLSITLDGEELLPREPITADPFLRQHASEVEDQLAALTNRILALESAEVAWADVVEKPVWVDELPADLATDLSDGELEWANLSGVPTFLEDETVELADISDLSGALVTALGTGGDLADGVHWSDLLSDPESDGPRIHRDSTELYFDGFNIAIRNGSDQTHEAKNGLGNLVVGYNDDLGVDLDRTGSHNIVVGDLHSYRSTGGIVSGINNTIDEVNAAAIGGESQIVTGIAAVAVGGETNIVSARGAVAVGGYDVKVLADNAATLGGLENRAAGTTSAIVGGFQNRTTCSSSAAVGGVLNLAGEVEDPSVWEATCSVSTSTSAVTVGGFGNYAGAFTAVVTGGQGGAAEGRFSSIQGGRNNTAEAEWAVVAGGRHNTASGEWSGVFGGGNEPTLLADDEEGNLATGQGAVVVGGIGNSATSRNALVVGGQVNQADGPDAVVAGGNQNVGSGNDSVLVGGTRNSLTGSKSVLLGGSDNSLDMGNRTHAGTCPLWKVIVGPDDERVVSTCDG